MNRVFADTSFWIAMLNPRDPWHESAKAAEKLVRSARIITTDEVLTEFVNHSSKSDAHERAAVAKLVHDIRDNRKIDVLRQSRETFDAGLALFESRQDKHYSLTDCISFAAMKSQGLSDALSSDAHFAQERFNILMHKAT